MNSEQSDVTRASHPVIIKIKVRTMYYLIFIICDAYLFYSYLCVVI